MSGDVLGCWVFGDDDVCVWLGVFGLGKVEAAYIHTVMTDIHTVMTDIHTVITVRPHI